MKRWHVIVLGALLIGTLSAGVGASIWWKRSRTLQVAHFDVPAVEPTAPQRVKLMPVVTGLEQPTDVQFVPGDSTRAIVVEQNGHARVIDIGPALKGGDVPAAQTAPLAFDIWVRPQSEMGLLGIAFHPKYRENGLVYAYYDPWVHDTLISRIAEFSLPYQDLGARTAVEKRVLLEFPQQFMMHQGGQVAFGPDGKLYVGIGDGSTANDPAGHAQDLAELRGKLLRFDVDGPTLVPKDNPFVQRAGARPEIWAYGLRNPWRFSFDPKGRPIVGDVGQEGREEISMVEAGANMGWNKRQGRVCHAETLPLPAECGREGLVDPIVDYDRTVGSCIIGGYLVTGTRVPSLTGKYVYGDFVRGRIWAVTLPDAPPAPGADAPNLEPELLGEWPRLFSTFARDAAGDVYIADVATGELLALMPLN
jgi:glucose/arabinose dehydrogenase